MTHIHERIFLKCAYARARRCVHERAGRLVPEIPPFELEVRPAEDPLRFDERLHVRWSPKDRALLPTFEGEIALRAVGPGGSAVLELYGDYAPPLGAPGRAFDLFVGVRIATATAKNVLREMASAIERAA